MDKANFSEMLGDFNSRNKKRKQLQDKKYGKTDTGTKSFTEFDKPSKLSMRMKYWRPSEEPTRIRLIPTSPENPFYTYFQSWVKVNGKPRTVICNDRNGEIDVPCLVSYYAIKDENPALLPSKREAVSVLILEEFFKVAQTSKAGNQYFKYVRSKGVNRFGRSQDPVELQDTEKVFGQKYHWSMGAGHRRQLEAQLEEITEKCGSCKEGFISVHTYSCSECGEEVASHKDRDIPEEEVFFLRNEAVRCPSCDHTGLAAQQTECVHKKGFGSSAEWVPGCDTPTKVNLWDLELVVSTTGEGTSTSIVINDWSLAEDRDVKEWLTTPFDFDYFFGYMDLEEQSKTMGRENPFNEESQKLLENHFSMSSSEEEQFTEPY